MKKFKFFVLTLLVLLLPNGANALENNKCMVYEKGSKVVDAVKIDGFEKELKKKVQDLNNSNGFLNDYKYNYILSIKTDDKVEKTNLETVLVSDKFVSEEEAIKYYNNITLDSPFVKGDYKVSVIEVPRTEIVKSDSISCKGLDCLKEINDLKSTLTENQKLNYEIVFNYETSDEVKQVIYKDKEGVVYFDEEADAKAFADIYDPWLSGYKFINNEVKSDILTTEVSKTYEELVGNNSFDSEKEAREALDKFKDEYNVTSSKIEKVRNHDKDKVDTGTITFNSKEEADEWIKDNEVNSSKGELKTEVTVSKEKYDESLINGEYASREEAEEALDKLKEQGYKISNEKIEEVSSGVTGEVQEAIKIDKNNSSYTFKEGTDYVLIKQGSGHYAVWTEEELSYDEKVTFVDSYKKVNTDGSTSNISLDEITWIYGFDSFDLSYIGKNWGTYIFSKKGNNVVLENPQGKISHVVYGGLEKIASKYILSGTKYKEREIYKLEYTKTIYGFCYKIKAEALVEDKVTKYKVISNFQKLIKKATLKYNIEETFFDKMYELKYEKYIPLVKKIAYLDWVIKRCEYPREIVTGSHDYPNPPQTGVSENSFIIVLTLGVMLVFYGVYRFAKNNL